MVSSLKVYINSFTPKIIFLSFLFSCLALLLGNYVIYGVAVILIGVLWLLLGEQLLLVLVIISLFTLFAEARNIIKNTCSLS